MYILPAIDLRGGNVVRLFRGDYGKENIYSDSPLSVAKSFEEKGASHLHTVDLDGALSGGNENYDKIAEIIKNTNLSVEIGGGIRDMNAVEKYVSAGAARVIIGTAAVKNPAFLKQAVSEYGDKIAVGVDIKGDKVATHGWTVTSDENYMDFCKKLQDIGVKTVICTDISKDGAMQGTNRALYKELCSHFDINFIASGGISTLDDLRAVKAAGVWGAILGKALYTGNVDLSAALEVQ
ncbi:MAG: 1-(5-phosphoribosyl)-5-[Clostridia bacterium]|nr:1-(5-phosphoribosyl)-5-[(5-phosphoribosylamino)methylideneamino]imidazole-4-carboxamide isomerase [Clostridia bacterium]